MALFLPFFTILEVQYFGLRNFSKILNFYKNSKSQNMDIFGLRIFVKVQYDIFKILSPKNIYRSLPSQFLVKTALRENVNLSLLWANQSVTKFQSINFKVESDSEGKLLQMFLGLRILKISYWTSTKILSPKTWIFSKF